MCRLQKQPVVFAQRLVYLKAPKKVSKSEGKKKRPLTEMRGNLCTFLGSPSVCTYGCFCVFLLLLDKYVLKVLGLKEQASGA